MGRIKPVGSLSDDAIPVQHLRHSTQSPTPASTTLSRKLSSSLSRRFSFLRRHSQNSVNNPDIICTPPPPPVDESVEDPLAAVGAALPSPLVPPGSNNTQASETSQLHPVAATQNESTPVMDKYRPLSFMPGVADSVSYAEIINTPQTPRIDRPPIERRPSRRERLAAGLSRSLSRRTSSGHSYSDSYVETLGSIYRRSLNRTASGRVVRMPTQEELRALEEQRARQKYPYSVNYDYMGSMAYCDGAWFTNELDYD